MERDRDLPRFVYFLSKSAILAPFIGLNRPTAALGSEEQGRLERDGTVGAADGLSAITVAD